MMTRLSSTMTAVALLLAPAAVQAAPAQDTLASKYPHIPAMADLSGPRAPRYLDVRIASIESNANRGGLYGSTGIYAFCETSRGSTPLPVFGGNANRVWSYSSSARNNRSFRLTADRGTRRFTLDQRCLANRNARIRIEVRGNFTEKRVGRNTSFGTRRGSIYLDQLPRASGGEVAEGLGVRPSGRGRWGMIMPIYLEAGRPWRGIFTPWGAAIEIRGAIRLVS